MQQCQSNEQCFNQEQSIYNSHAAVNLDACHIYPVPFSLSGQEAAAVSMYEYKYPDLTHWSQN